MRKALPLLLVAAIAMGGCSIFGNKSAAPDEFAVARNAPLVIPPDYTLTPPVAGTAGITPEAAQAQAIEALFGGPAPRSTSERLLLDKAGRDRATIGVRSTVGDAATRVVDKGQVTTAILAAPESNGQIASAQ
jgi:hypothetical protein